MIEHEYVPPWRINDARTYLDGVIKRAGEMGTRDTDAVNTVLGDYAKAAERAGVMIDICNEERRIADAQAQIDAAGDQIEHLKTKL